MCKISITDVVKKTVLCVLLMLTVKLSSAQSPEYLSFIKKAFALYQAKDYKNSALAYSNAFKSFGGKGTVPDRYNAACSWALANVADSAFYHLNRIATKGNYADYEHLSTDSDLKPLYGDKRWKDLLALVKSNKEKAEANLDKPLAARLDAIYREDQGYRMQLDSIRKKYGWESEQMKNHWKLINKTDSINLLKITSILDSRGWLGADIVGEKGNKTLFLVIQHADLHTQEKYLPMMREALKRGHAQAADLALLEDRVALRQGKKQIYGSQITQDPITKQYNVSPLEDPDNVDKRRASVGLQPIAEYVKMWQIKWDVSQYKKDLLKLMEQEKKIINK